MTTKTSRKKEKVNVEEEIMAGYTLRNILRLLWQNRFRVDRKYFLRFLYGLGVSALLWPLRTLEWLITAPRIAATRIEKDPVFIIGYYRSGTTYLITLFSKDPNRAYVSNVEGYLPTLFLGFPRLARWIINMSIPESRPMDNVVMTPEEPTEEEYSIGAYEKYSIYNGFVWPRNFKLYSRYNSFDGLPDDLERWKRRHHWFTRKLTASYHGKQIVYKNPTATFRIKHILQLYPNAKFVHIYRNPYEVLSSNIRYHDDVIKIYAVEIKYEDFIQKPMEHIEHIYRELDLEGFEEARPFMQEHVESQRSYRPNKHKIGKNIVGSVNREWSHIVEMLGYEKMDEAEAPDESSVIIPES
jgi:hypothetical protein